MKENSIEEHVKILEKMLKSYKEADECGLSTNDFKKEIKALEYILTEYKRALKENEELKTELKDSVIAIKLYALQTENEKQKN